MQGTVSGRPQYRIGARSSKSARLALVYLALLHLGAVFLFLPSREVISSKPLYAVDYPVHTHRVYMYQEGLSESRLPWGYDPGIAAGAVLAPNRDLGAKAIKFLGFVVPFLDPVSCVSIFLLFTLLTFPLWPWLACRRLGLTEDQQVWVLIVILVPAWLDPRLIDYLQRGLVTYWLSAFFSVYVLALFLNYLQHPNWRLYTGFILAASALFLMHILGPFILLPPLVIFTLLCRPLPARSRLALIFAPILILALNAFWYVPYRAARGFSTFPPGLWPTGPPDGISHKIFATWSDLSTILLEPLTLVPLLAALLLAWAGLNILKKSVGERVPLSIGLAFLFGLGLLLFGSFIPVVVTTQPARFLVPTFVLLCIPIGATLDAFARRLRLPSAATAAVLATGVAIAAINFGSPAPLPLNSDFESLKDFVQTRTERQSRLLIQSSDGYRYGGYEAKLFPLIFDREVIGNNFQLTNDPPQFLSNMLLGRRISDWQPEELMQALNRWGIAWAFTVTPQARSLIAKTLKHSGEKVGIYQAFRVPEPKSRFARGKGNIQAAVNRFDLSDLRADDGLVVLRYRYHPGWTTVPDIPVYRYPVPEDPSGFIALKDPPPSVTLHFQPWSMLYAPWPEPLGLEGGFPEDSGNLAKPSN